MVNYQKMADPDGLSSRVSARKFDIWLIICPENDSICEGHSCFTFYMINMWISYIMLFFVILFDRSEWATWASYKRKDIHLYNHEWQAHRLWIIICRSYVRLCVCACAVCITSRLRAKGSRETVIIMSLKRVTSGTWGPSSNTEYPPPFLLCPLRQ